MLLSTRAQACGRLGSFERVEPGAEARRRARSASPRRDHADTGRPWRRSASTAEARVECPAGERLQVDASSRWRPAISNAGTIRTPKTSRKTAKPINRSGARTSGLVAAHRVAQHCLRAARTALRARREATRQETVGNDRHNACQLGASTKNRWASAIRRGASRRASALVYRTGVGSDRCGRRRRAAIVA